MIEYQHLLPFSSLPDLTEDEIDDAEFRGRDAAWAALVRALEIRREKGDVSYEALGERIGRSRSQVQRWLAEPANMTIMSLSLLAEALDSDLIISVEPRMPVAVCVNYCHPSNRTSGMRISHSVAIETVVTMPSILVTGSKYGRVKEAAAHPQGKDRMTAGDFEIVLA